MIEGVCSLQIKIKGVMILTFNCITGLLVDGLSVSHILYDVYIYVPQNKEKSISLKTLEDGQVLLYSVSFLTLATALHSCFFVALIYSL